MIYHYQAIVTPTDTKQLAQSIHYFERQLLVNPKKDDPLYSAQALNLIALGYYNTGNLFESEKAAVASYTALELVEETPQSRLLQVSLGNHLGRLYRGLGDATQALRYYTQTLPLVSSQRERVILLNNIASIHIDTQAYQKAAEVLAPLIPKLQQIKEPRYQSTLLDNYGYSLLQTGDLEGMALIAQAEEINREVNYSRGLFSTQRHLATYYLQKGEKEQAKAYASSALAIATRLQVPKYREEALGLAIETGDTSQALAYKRLSDSLKTAKQEQENTYIAQKYAYALFKTQAKESELLAQQERSKNRSYQFLVIVAVLAALGIAIVMRVLHKKKRLEERFKTEARLSKKIHDEVSNDVYRVITQIQNNKEVHPEVLDHLEDIYSRTRNISKENSPVLVAHKYHETLNDLFLSYQSDSLSIITRNNETLAWQHVSKAKKITIYRVLQELITNTIKHGRASIVLITFTKIKNNLQIHYKDNGVGGHLSGKNGLQNVESRILAHQGTITFESTVNKGFEANIHI